MDPNLQIIIDQSNVVLAAAYALAGVPNPLDEVPALKLRLTEAEALVDELTTADAAEDAKRAALKAKLQGL